MTRLVLLDTNAYLRLAKRIKPLLGVKFGQVDYVLTILSEVEKEVHKQPRLQFLYPWFDGEDLRTERLAKQTRLTKLDRRRIEAAQSILLDHVANNVENFIQGGRSPPGPTDCFCLAFGQVRPAIVVTDDLGMHALSDDFELPVWHSHELLKKLLSAKMIDADKVREIYEALEENDDLTRTWEEAKHTIFKKIFGKKKD